MKQSSLFILFLVVCCSISIAQISYNWNSFPAGGSSYSNTQSGGCTMNTTVNGIQFNAGAPKFDNAVGTNGTGLFLDHNWSNTSSATDVVSTFAPALTNPSFTLYDINHNANTSDFCSNAWTDSVFVTAVGATAVSYTQTNPLQQTLQIVGATLKIVGIAACNQTTQGSVTISFAGPVTQISIKYLSGKNVTRCSTFTPCGAAVTPPCVTLVPCTDPARQFITIGNITGASCCSGPTSPPTSITGGGPFCVPTAVTLVATGAFSNSQWHAGSCGAPVIGTGTSISVTPTVTTTYYVNNLDCNNNPTGCTPITITINPKPATPTISNSGLSICAGKTTTLTSSSSTGNTWSTGATSQSIIVSTAGTYTLTVTNAFGCVSSSASVNITNAVSPATPIITANGPLAFCPGGSVILSSSSVTGNQWSNGATTQSIIVNNAGTFTVAVTNGGGCSSTSSVINTTLLSAPPASSITNTGLTICTAQSTTLTSSSITGNNWNTGATSQSIVVNTAGTYSTYVTGVNGCVSPTTSVTVNIIAPPSSPTITSSGSNTLCAGNSVVLSSSNATGNLWNTGATTQTILVNTTGNYSVTTGSGSCASSSSVYTINVLPLPATPSITASANNLCAGQSSILSSSSILNNSWSSGATTQTIQVNTTGTYSLTIIDVNGCSSPTTSITITINTTPLHVLVPSNVIACNNSIVAAQNFTSSTGATYVWQNTNPLIGLPSNGVGSIPSFTAVNSSTTSGNAIITVTPTALGCSGTPSSFTISVNPSLIINAGVNDTLCFAEVKQFNATPNITGYTYNWLPANAVSNASLLNPIASPSITTIYTLTVTDANGCYGSDDITLFVNFQLNSVVSTTNISCFNLCNGSSFASVNGGNAPYQYNWSNGQSTQGATNLCSGIFSLTIKDSWNCLASNTVSITQPSKIVASIVSFSNALCYNACNGSASGTASGGTTPYTFNWNSTPSQSAQQATNLCSGTYMLKVKDFNNCMDSITVQIAQPSSVTLTPSSSVTICNGAFTNLSATAMGGSNSGYTYTWSPSSTLSNSNSANVIATPNVNTTYTVIASDINGCLSNTATILVTIKAPLAISVINTSFCAGNSTSLNASVIGGNSSSYSYLWNPSIGLSNSTIANPTANATTTTVYTVTVDDGCSTPATNQLTVTVLPLPIINISSSIQSGCAPLCVNFFDESTVASSGVVSWQWSFENNQTSTVQNPNNCFNNSGNYAVTLMATSFNGCTSTKTFSNYITAYPNPVADFIVPEEISVVAPEVQFTNNSIGASQWLWNFNDLYCTITQQTSALENPIHNYLNQGAYCVNLLVTNTYGCTDTKTKCLEIKPEFTIYVPNTFTPNDDGINDIFTAVGINIIEFEMLIFDRWGEEIFHTNDIKKGWDGVSKKGPEQSKQDVYVWQIKAKDVFNKEHRLVGHVTLLR